MNVIGVHAAFFGPVVVQRWDLAAGAWVDASEPIMLDGRSTVLEHTAQVGDMVRVIWQRSGESAFTGTAMVLAPGMVLTVEMRGIETA